MLLVAPLLVALSPQVVPDLASGPREVEYVVRAASLESDADGHVPLDVTATFRHPRGAHSLLSIPHWTPGSYRLRTFPDHVEVRAVTAIDAAGTATPLDPLATHRGRWLVEHGDIAALVVDYRVLLGDDDRFMAPPNERRSLTYEGPQLYLFRRGMLDAPCHVRFELPDGWQVGSGLLPGRDGGWFATDYDFLADCPVKLGELRRWTFTTAGVPIDVVADLPAELEFEEQDWIDNIRRVTEVQAEMFGGLPCRRYTFLFCASRTGKGGGLEHLTSTAIGLSIPALLRSPRASLGTVAHEFFHLWNVKRARPAALGPFDYSKPNRTTMLWLCEGLTSYYTAVSQARAGLTTADAFWRGMQNEINRLERTPGRVLTSSSDASWQVWDRVPASRRVNYYNSGAVLGLLLDLRIRDLTDNRRSLDDLMRGLWRQCETTGRGYADADVERHLLAITGHDFTPWFDAHVRGTVRPDYATLLAAAGIEAELRVRDRPALQGFASMPGPDGAMAWWAPPEASRARDFWSAAGRIVAIDGEAVTGRNEAIERITAMRPGAAVTLRLATPLGAEIERRVVLDAEPTAELDFTVLDDADGRAVAIRDGITAGSPTRPGAR